MKLFHFLLLSQLLLCTLVCSHHGGPHDDDDHDHHDHHDHQHTEEKALLQLTAANLQFSYKLYYHLATAYANKNFFFSPLSISVAFSLLSLGAKSKTLSQIREAFGFNTSLISEEDIHKGFQQLLKTINHPKSNLQLDSANALFIDDKINLLDKFLNDTKNFYQAEAISTDFQKIMEAIIRINSYVEEKTHGKIEALLDSLDPLTVLVIVNTIFFKGSWEHSFNVNHTREGDFYVDKDTVVKVPMMTRRGEYLMAVLPEVGCALVDIPYKGNASAIIVLPEKGKLHEVEKAFQKVSLATWAKEMRPREILLTIPKVSITGELDLVKELQALGITDVFSDHADLSGITGGSNLKVSKALHKAALDIDEEGTEAAAATAIGIKKLSLPFHFKVDSPFIFTMIFKDTGTVGFTGRIINPKQ
ncbi:alpha-1-antitrypsin-like protein GS55-MS [Eleutherodactylus coqui]|uniref:Serpin domain-containing protein n=1 Tax=Eleutherodactylus coqui TaxID=57060 RepID=A0A8J6EGC5_ELECQ|nr:hypothetical protein GDO78_022691 [Eleutherodactylus coqui]